MKLIFAIVALVLCATLVTSRAAIPPTSINRATFEKWMCSSDETCVQMEKDSVNQIATKFMKRMQTAFTDFSALEEIFAGNDRITTLIRAVAARFNGRKPTLVELRDMIRKVQPKATYNATYPYFAWMPIPMTHVIAGQAPVTYSTPCFTTVTASSTAVNSSFVLVTINLQGQTSLFCTDAYLMVGGGAVSIQEFDAAQQVQIYFNVSEVLTNTADKWYLDTTGIRLMKFQDGLLETVGELLDTLIMMAGFLEKPVSPTTFQDNLNFLNNYIKVVPRFLPKSVIRTAGASVGRAIDPNYINTGDALIVVRPDGLDPMIGWGEGSDAGHSTIAMRFPGSNDLHICESTSKDAYWPTNGIQCHPWAEWVNLTDAAQYNTVIVPLSPKYAAKFNATLAAQFFQDHEGVDYGYATFLFGWIDTVSANFPCVPPDYTTCLFPQTAEVIAVLLDRLFENNHENFFRQALAHRVNMWPAQTPVLESLMIAATQMNLTFTQLYIMPEQDSWQYNTTRNGVHVASKSMVCCVFVCNMWKAAGIFSEINDEINCGEQTLWDIYSMAIFDSTKFGTGRPQICQETDPVNPLCQITGNFTFNLQPDVNTRALYAHMGESCSSLGPQYIRSPGC